MGMSWIRNLFHKRAESPLGKAIGSFDSSYKRLLSLDRFLSYSDTRPLLKANEAVYAQLLSAQKQNNLRRFCRKNLIDIELAEGFLRSYFDLQGNRIRIKEHNDDFVKAKEKEEGEYLDKILSPIDPRIKLDEDQKQAILRDEDHTLLIAGAGAGKTTTLAAKTRYLVERQKVKPEEILLISFTNKAVDELKERINGKLHIDCPIATFHSAGSALLRGSESERKRIVEEGFLYNSIDDYLRVEVLSDPKMVDALILFFGAYFRSPYDEKGLLEFFKFASKGGCLTLKGDLKEYSRRVIEQRTRRLITISKEEVRSIEEAQIANFLYLNGIDYTYEEEYRYHILKAKKPYTPDFTIHQNGKTIYLEHFGLTDKGENSLYNEKQLRQYKQAIRDKIALHKAHGTKLIFTFSSYSDSRSHLAHLKEALLKEGIVLRPRDHKEVLEKLLKQEESRYVNSLTKLLLTFLSNFKSNGYGQSTFRQWESQDFNVRTKLFLKIAQGAYLHYQAELLKTNSRDFSDLIGDAAKLLEAMALRGEKLPYRYIIIDEYQDISRQRFDLVKALKKVSDAKIIAVGDDWQSIYAFSGSDVSLFTHFIQLLGDGEQLQIRNTYRNSQEVIDIAGDFIQKNDFQIKKSLHSDKHIDKPVCVITYDDYNRREKGGVYKEIGDKLLSIVKTIWDNGDPLSATLLVGRYGFDARNCCHSDEFVYDELNGKMLCRALPKAKIEFLTAHSSKGLGYDNVVIVNAKDAIYGFPSQIDDDPVLSLVTSKNEDYEYAEERRLFYVALTRTKNRVFILTPKHHPSRFVLELLRDYPSVYCLGELEPEAKSPDGVLYCPECGFPLVEMFSPRYGMKVYCCSNEPEICDFLTNDPASGLPILKCDCCQDGYLIAKRAKNHERKGDDYVLGCTNYKEDGTGCSRILNRGFVTKMKKGYYQEIDFSKLPSYQKAKMEEAFLSQSGANERQTTKREARSNVNLALRKEMELKGFSLILDQTGEVLTDMALLKALIALRRDIAKRDKIVETRVCSNTALVNLSTYHPSNKAEFINLYGLSEKSYGEYGEMLLKKIIESSKDQ